jgi:hypothetical protein
VWGIKGRSKGPEREVEKKERERENALATQ